VSAVDDAALGNRQQSRFRARVSPARKDPCLTPRMFLMNEFGFWLNVAIVLVENACPDGKPHVDIAVPQ
jgi:hypothetical protein